MDISGRIMNLGATMSSGLSTATLAGTSFMTYTCNNAEKVNELCVDFVSARYRLFTLAEKALPPAFLPNYEVLEARGHPYLLYGATAISMVATLWLAQRTVFGSEQTLEKRGKVKVQ